MEGSEPKTIAFDFDDTLTAEPELITGWMKLAKAAGHTVIVASYRFNTQSNMDEINAFLEHYGITWCPIVLCDHNCKDDACLARGYEVDIWLDDMPELIRRCYSQ